MVRLASQFCNCGCEVTCGDSHPDHTSPSSPLSAKGVRVIHQRFQSRQSRLPGTAHLFGATAVLVDTVEHLNVSDDDMHWPAHLAQYNSSSSKAAIGNHHRSPRQPSPHLASFVWPNPSAACVDDFAVRGSVVKGLRRLETVMPRPAVPKESAQKHQTQPPQTTGFNKWLSLERTGCDRSPWRLAHEKNMRTH